MFDVVIVGGGPAGLSAALVLGRCRRRVLLVDAGQPRNAVAQSLHGYLTRDGTPPRELLRIGREEIRQYGIDACDSEVTTIVPAADGFTAALANGRTAVARTVLIASGVRDHLPDIPGIEECYGISVHHCPYCDGWEVRDKTLAVVGRGAAAAGLALSLLTWSAKVMICTNGPDRLTPSHRAKLAQHGITIVASRIARIEHDNGRIHGFALAGGSRVDCEAVFFSTGQGPQSDLARRLGCEITGKGVVKTDHLGRTCVPNVFVAGDASHDVQFAVVAAAEGAKAAVAINKLLQAREGLAPPPPQ